MPPRQAEIENRILSRLSPADFALLAGALEWVDLPLAMTLADQGAEIVDLYFMESGVTSIVVNSPEGQSAEGGIIGREGYVVPAVVLGDFHAPHRIEIQMAGTGYRISRDVVIAAARVSATLRERLLLFAQALSIQMAYTVLSNAAHHVDERLARWLLMCHDRSPSDDLALTHNFMSVMLSVRRPSVTTALHLLEGRGYIRSERRYVTIVNRRGLEDFAGDAYGRPEADYVRLLGTM